MFIIKKIFWGLVYFLGINFIYNKIKPAKLLLVGGHSISSKEDKEKLHHKLYKDYSIDKKFLEKQIKYLLRKNYRFLNFEKIDEILSKGQKLSKKSIVMYFDDGFKDIYLNAYPIFKKYNLPFVIFVSTDLIDRNPLPKEVSRRLAKLSREQEKIFLTWEEIKEIDLAEIGSHGVTHKDFIDLTDQELKKELLKSGERIKKETGKKPIALSYPHGKYNQKIKNLVEITGYKFAVITKGGQADLRDKFELKNIVIYPTDNMLIFKLKLGIFYRITN